MCCPKYLSPYVNSEAGTRVAGTGSDTSDLTNAHFAYMLLLRCNAGFGVGWGL